MFKFKRSYSISRADFLGTELRFISKLKDKDAMNQLDDYKLVDSVGSSGYEYSLTAHLTERLFNLYTDIFTV